MFGRVRALTVPPPRVVALTLSSSSPSPSHPHRSTRRPRRTAHALRPRCRPDRHGARRHQALDRSRASRPLLPFLLLACRRRPCADSVPSHPHPSPSRSAADDPHVPPHRPALAKIKNRDLRALASSCASLPLSRLLSCADGLACLFPELTQTTCRSRARRVGHGLLGVRPALSLPRPRSRARLTLLEDLTASSWAARRRSSGIGRSCCAKRIEGGSDGASEEQATSSEILLYFSSLCISRPFSVLDSCDARERNDGG